MVATYSSLVGLAVGGKYEVRRVLGIGGMGVVCEAIHLDLGKRVAIKLIDKNMKESELIVARFRREARALGQIQSEHIVDVFDVGADARVGLYMVMEHLVGEDLQTRLEREKRLEVPAGVMVAHQMTRALEKAHAAGIIHRDLKPANVFLTKRDDGSLLVKLLDFGVSKMLDESAASRITGSGAPIGTPLYMSPEQAEGKDDTDGRADIWSLGAVLYEALAGAPPFADRGSYHTTIVGILTSRPRPLHEAAPWVPAPLARVVDAMLVHDRDARIKDAATVTHRLREAHPVGLPDGTGRHTAVIVQAATAVDATGDTEIFTSAGFAAAQPTSSRRSLPDDDEDSKRTLPHTPRPGAAGALAQAEAGGAGKPEEATSGESAEKDAAAWPQGASSSANGVAMPGTPPLMAPVLLSDVAPDTQRDATLAVRAERRRWLTLGVIAAFIAAVAAGGYVAGRRSGAPDSRAAGPSAPTAPVPATTTSAPPAAASMAPAPVLDEPPAPPIITPHALPSATATASAPAPRPRRRSPRGPAAVAPDPKRAGESAPAADDPAPAPDPPPAP